MDTKLIEKYKNVKERIDKVKTENELNLRMKKTFEETLKKLKNKRDDYEEEIETLELALKLFQEVSDERNASAKESLETVINWTLSKVFTSQSYEVKIEEHPDARSGKIMEIYLIDGVTGHKRSVKTQLGTALVQIISFLMMLIVIKFAGSSKILLLDEVFSGLEDKEAITLFSEVLTSLAKNEGFQVLIVEQNSLISANPDFKRINVALENPADGLILESIA